MAKKTQSFSLHLAFHCADITILKQPSMSSSIDKELTFSTFCIILFSPSLKKVPQTYLSIRMQGNQSGHFPELKTV